MAIAGEDFCVIAADTRQSTGYSINTRDAPKAFQLYVAPTPAAHFSRLLTRENWGDRNKGAVIASSGFYGDITQLNRSLHMQLEMYKHQHNKEMSCPAIAQMLSGMLYRHRFFPLYTFNILGGLDENGAHIACCPSPPTDACLLGRSRCGLSL